MSNRPTCDVDVVIPVYNTERYIAGALRSVLNQTTPPCRVIIVDDGSTDASAARVAEVIAGYSGPTTVDCIQKQNGGLSSARNFGIARCSSRYIAFLDADDVWMPAKLETQLRVFETSSIERLGLVYCAYHVIGTEGEPLPQETVVNPDSALRGDVFDALLEANRVSGSGSGVLILSSELDAAGDFDEELKAAEDWDMWLRLAQHCGFDFAPDDLVAIRRHAASMQADKQHMLANMLRFFIKWFPNAQKRAGVMRQWSHVIAEFALRSKDPAAARHLVERTLPAVMRRSLFHRTWGSLRLHMFIKRLRTPRANRTKP